MKRSIIKLSGIILLLFVGTGLCFAQQQNSEKAKMVGGALMYPSKNIIENAIHSKAHTTLVAAVKAAGLVKTLEGKGPFTVFAPTNKAFKKLPKGTVKTLLKPSNKAKLRGILTYHVVLGEYTSAKIRQLIKKDDGMAKLKTVNGGYLKFKYKGHHLWVIDAQGNKAKVTIPDVYQSNGVIQVINRVLLPKSM